MDIHVYTLKEIVSSSLRFMLFFNSRVLSFARLSLQVGLLLWENYTFDRESSFFINTPIKHTYIDHYHPRWLATLYGNCTSRSIVTLPCFHSNGRPVCTDSLQCQPTMTR